MWTAEHCNLIDKVNNDEFMSYQNEYHSLTLACSALMGIRTVLAIVRYEQSHNMQMQIDALNHLSSGVTV
jgi:hypothetical protein